MDNLKKMKKDELLTVVSEYEQTISTLKEKVDALSVADTDKDTNSKIGNLLAEVERLRDQLKVAKETEKFVAIENLSLGRVWLYSPESKSGRPEDRNKGRLLKQTGELSIVPSYWMAGFIADRAPAFLQGELRLNNEQGRRLSPHLVFEDYDLPKEFLSAAIPNEAIEKAISGTSERFYDFIETHRDKKFILNRIYGVVDRAAHAAENKSKKKSILEGFVSYLDEIIHPTIEEAEERDEMQPVI